MSSPSTTRPPHHRPRRSSELPRTCTVMLAGLSASDGDQWERFVKAYWPALVAYAQRKGVPAEEARDLAQDTFVALRATLAKAPFDRQRGGLRTLVFAIAYRQVANWFRARGGPGAGGAGAGGAPSPGRAVALPETGMSRVVARRAGACESVNGPARRWARGGARGELARCLEKVRAEVSEQTYTAFEMVGLREVPVERVAADLRMTENAVYGAKRRVLDRLRELLRESEQ